jgi:cysteinyl-tRNA synthetase
MSKSEGNFVTISQLLHGDTFGGRLWPGAVLRLAMLRTHYRQPIDWTVRALEDAERTLGNWANVLDRHGTGFVENDPPPSDVIGALTDDLNTPQAIGEMHKLAEAARKGDLSAAQGLHQSIKFMVTNDILSSKDHASVGEAAVQLLSEEVQRDVKSKVDARNAARRDKNFKEADRIRDELLAMGFVLKDSKDGTTWEVAR